MPGEVLSFTARVDPGSPPQECWLVNRSLPTNYLSD